jgi:hypothetical protein
MYKFYDTYITRTDAVAPRESQQIPNYIFFTMYITFLRD